MTIIARLVFLALFLCAIGYGAMWALALLVEPEIRETTIQVPASKFVR